MAEVKGTNEEQQRSAMEVINNLSEKDSLSEFEYELLKGAQDVVHTARWKREMILDRINTSDIKDMFPLYKQLSDMDVESHEDVIGAQKLLTEYGYYGDELDSLYGENTKRARLEMKEDISRHPQFLVHTVMEQARNLFDSWGD